jgi:hypothetical protein
VALCSVLYNQEMNVPLSDGWVYYNFFFELLLFYHGFD